MFTVVMTVVCAGLLAWVAVTLKPMHKEQALLDTKKNILSCVLDISSLDSKGINQKYDELVEGFVVNSTGEVVPGVDPLTIDAKKEWKKAEITEKHFPVYKVNSEVFSGVVDAYVLPVYGSGLWDNIFGYVAIAKDKKSVKGVVFDHKAETPGLGARITDNKGNTGDANAFQERFAQRLVYNEAGEVGIKVLKGEKNAIAEEDKFSVDGLSGASMTTGGLNRMLAEYLAYYKPYLTKK